jgi:hypothetical protein
LDNNSDAYRRNKLNEQIFSSDSKPLSSFYKSTKYYFTDDYVKEGYSLLDIGGGGGVFAAAIKKEVADIDVTVIDPDPGSIRSGRDNFPEFSFIEGYFPQDMPQNNKYDIVSMQALFPQLPNWKETMLALSSASNKYINISLTFKLNGTTVIDKDVSYFYYLDSGQRVHQVIHNIYEFMNFCCIHEMNIKKIEFFGYHTPKSGHNFRCVPNSEQIKGNLMLEVFQNKADNPKRVGGAVEYGHQFSEYNFFIPEMNIIIDGERFSLRD